MYNAVKLTREMLGLVDDYRVSPEVSNTGVVLSVGDGIARVGGLSQCKYGELVEFEDSTMGMAMNLEKDSVGVVLLGKGHGIRAGGAVLNTTQIMRVPVGDALIGRVVNPLGMPLDGKGPIENSGFRPIEAEAPYIKDREQVNRPLQTGLTVIDAVVPIGRGQRELIIGDRQTGKTAITLDTIINQKGKDVICVYVAIGQKASSITQITEILDKNGALEYTFVVSASASDPAPLQYIAPYAGCAMAEEFMYAGKDVLIIYDDLSKHAVAYREMSLLLRRPPGREAYPGDVFYLHSRLLERAAQLSKAAGGGSITALPLIETMAGDISAYIPTNVISITDGQIFLESELFHSGVRPAVNVGLSVSRVGGSAQTKAMRKVAGSLRLDLAQYRELSVFAQFGSDLDTNTRELLEQGARLIEVLKQDRYAPRPLDIQVVSLFVVANGLLKGMTPDKVRPFMVGFLEYALNKYPQMFEEIADTKLLSDQAQETIRTALDEYMKMTKA